MQNLVTGNRLLSEFDKDPGRWRPYKYGLILDVPVDEEEAVEGDMKLLNQPFILTQITTNVVGNVSDYEGTGLADDGQYFVEWREEQSVYQNAPLLAKSAFGTETAPIPLPAPIGFAGNRVLVWRVRSAYTRVLSPDADTFKVQIIIHGVANWGELR
jgi:hypothetical protein